MFGILIGSVLCWFWTDVLRRSRCFIWLVSRDSWIVMSMLLDLTALDITRNFWVVSCCLYSTRPDGEWSRITIIWRYDESRALLPHNSPIIRKFYHNRIIRKFYRTISNFDRTITAQFRILTAQLPHNYEFWPHNYRTICQFNRVRYRTIWVKRPH